MIFGQPLVLLVELIRKVVFFRKGVVRVGRRVRRPRIDAVHKGLDPVHLGGGVRDLVIPYHHDTHGRHRLVGPMESLSSGTYGGVGKPGPRRVDLYLDIVEVPKALLGDEAPDDGLEDPGIAAYREVVLLAGPGVRQEDMPVAEFLVIELVLLELDPLERAGDSLERDRLAVCLVALLRRRRRNGKGSGHAKTNP